MTQSYTSNHSYKNSNRLLTKQNIENEEQNFMAYNGHYAIHIDGSKR